MSAAELRDLLEAARQFAAKTGHPVDELDDTRILAGLRRLEDMIAARRATS